MKKYLKKKKMCLDILKKIYYKKKNVCHILKKEKKK